VNAKMLRRLMSRRGVAAAVLVLALVATEAAADAPALKAGVFDPPRQDWLDGNDAYLRGK